tara:strand:+ start:128 stop:1003 length:876 start_codon:yes stop_codon:yes gene_type:complete
MKHNLKITLTLILIFLLAQFTGLFVVNHYLDHDLPYDLQPPEIENKSYSFIPIIIGIVLGTLVFLLLAKFRKPFILKLWFFLTIWLTLSLSFNAFFNSTIAAILAIFFSVYRMVRPNIIVHNLTEIFIYGGLAAFLIPIFNIFSAILLLIFISIYDIIAVWKTKHMVTLAEFQRKSKLFAGISISYNKDKTSNKIIKKDHKKSKTITKKVSSAVLGGGDIGFPLIFASVVLKNLLQTEPITSAFLKTSIIPIITAIALLILLLKGEKDKYYPAMPFLSAGVFLGYIIVLLL